MTDLFGVPLNVGDKVVYTTGAQSNTRLSVGTILEIFPNNSAYIQMASGRKASNKRKQYELVSIKAIEEQHPEFFIWSY